KKPLYHFYPGKLILSLGTIGCNFACPFCQNWQISQDRNVPTQYMPPSEAVEKALERNSIGIAYTYSEPMIWYEYVMDTAKLAKKKGLKNVLVTNGYINEDPLKELLPLIDAMNIDLKAFDEKFYREICKGDLETVLKTIKISSASCHIEITNLVIPGLNDTIEHFENLVNWIAENTGANTPLHFSRYFPQYKMKTSSVTPIETLEQAYKIAKEKLKSVYLGNIMI
ncbi:AmmeMemoRadiSam system radical SAM enzyme, partial [bacterium]|nr:AmmeMemoRadiSam system radical SAM enzyme [bacterium]